MRSSPVEAIDGLGEDGAVGGAAAAAYGASAAMEEAEGDSALGGDLVQRAMRLPYLPCAGDHAAVLVGVGVAEHDFLLVVPGFEQRLVGGGGPELAADGGRVAQVADGLEERDGLQAGVPASFAGGVEAGVGAVGQAAGPPHPSTRTPARRASQRTWSTSSAVVVPLMM